MLYLASRSPRRRELLDQLGVTFEVVDVDVPELRDPSERAIDYVRRVAVDKALAGAAEISANDAAVLAADTEVILNDQVFGKPADELRALEMIQSLAGRTHQVVTAVAVASSSGTLRAESSSEVRFSTMTNEQIREYCRCGEWRGKAGGYAIQGRAAAYIEHLNGSYSGVMGLPLHETWNLLQQIEL